MFIGQMPDRPTRDRRRFGGEWRSSHVVSPFGRHNRVGPHRQRQKDGYHSRCEDPLIAAWQPVCQILCKIVSTPRPMPKPGRDLCPRGGLSCHNSGAARSNRLAGRAWRPSLGSGGFDFTDPQRSPPCMTRFALIGQRGHILLAGFDYRFHPTLFHDHPRSFYTARRVCPVGSDIAPGFGP